MNLKKSQTFKQNRIKKSPLSKTDKGYFLIFCDICLVKFTSYRWYNQKQK